VNATGPLSLRAIVHVGTHKTGTTAFQVYVDRWRDELLRDHDIRVHGGMFLPSHFELPALVIRAELETPDRWLLANQYPATGATLREHIRQTVESDAATVLFSAEGLSFMRTPAEAAALRDLLAPRHVQTVVVLRNPAEYLRAFRVSHQRWYSEPSAGRASVAYWEPDSWLVQYEQLIATLGLVGAPPAVIDYDAQMAIDGTVVPALLRAIGISDGEFYPGWDAVENPTQYEG
jgi:hypothetical protein